MDNIYADNVADTDTIYNVVNSTHAAACATENRPLLRSAAGSTALERAAYLLKALGNPERKLRVLHVAGTNGKSSVCRFIYESLLAMGYSAGIFTSPYVLNFSERIEANGAQISAMDLNRLSDTVGKIANDCAVDLGGYPTEFEQVTAMGLQYFASLGLDFVVLEAGLGGRCDATNIVEKPGIIKEGIPVVTAAKDAAAKAVIMKEAHEKGAPLVDISDVKAEIHEMNLWGSHFSIGEGGASYDNTDSSAKTMPGEHRMKNVATVSAGGTHYDNVGITMLVPCEHQVDEAVRSNAEGMNYDDIEITMPGEHQVENVVTALSTLHVLEARGLIKIDPDKLKAGLKNAVLPARFQVNQSESDGVIHIVDGAHNEEGARALVRALKEFCPNSRVLFNVSISRDKNADAILRILADVGNEKLTDTAFIAPEPSNDRALSAKEITAKIQAAGGTVIENMPNSNEDFDVIVYTGSLYHAGEMLRKL